jgi:hypothetical protein
LDEDGNRGEGTYPWEEKMQLTIGTLQIQHEMWIADITDDCILETDFLEPHGCLVDFKDGDRVLKKGRHSLAIDEHI